jgi:hypothetical protein
MKKKGGQGWRVGKSFERGGRGLFQGVVPPGKLEGSYRKSWSV